MKSKKNGEVKIQIVNFFLQIGHIFVKGIIDECTNIEEDKFDLEAKLEDVVKNII